MRPLTTYEGFIEIYYHFSGSKIQVDEIALKVQELTCRFPFSNVCLNYQPAQYIKGFQTQLIQEDLSLSAKVMEGTLQLALGSIENFVLPITYQDTPYLFTVCSMLKIKGLRKLIENQIKRSDFTIINIETGSPLREGGTLAQSRISQDSLLIIVLDDNPLERIHQENRSNSSLENGQGMSSLAFVNFRDEKNVFLDCKAPLWRTVIPGLSLEGKCVSTNCVAYGKWVCDPLGIDDFNMDKMIALAKCPVEGCGNGLEEVTNCIFWDCHYTITGLVKGKEQDKLEGFAPKEKALSFKKIAEGHQSNLIKWDYLKITTTPFLSPPHSFYDFCSIL